MSCYIYFPHERNHAGKQHGDISSTKVQYFPCKTICLQDFISVSHALSRQVPVFLATNLMSSELQIASDFIFLQLFIQKLWTTW